MKRGPGGRVGESLERKNIFVSSAPFGEVDPAPRDLLDRAGVRYSINPLGRRLKEEELAEFLGEADALIAGTDPVTAAVMDRAPRLGLISRVGIGLESVDLLAARERNIQVAYTPDGPTAAVAELTVGLMLALLRRVPQADARLRRGGWKRLMGRRLGEVTVGLVGMGRVGKRVVCLLEGFGARILANDIAPDDAFRSAHGFEWAEKDRIFREADVVSLHVPVTHLTVDLINRETLAAMKPGSVLVNTARGELADEKALADALRGGPLGSAAIDVYREEPYAGELTRLDNCLLTCHMGSMSEDCRARMETEAAQHAVRFLKGEPVLNMVPEEEYRLRTEAARGALPPRRGE